MKSLVFLVVVFFVSACSMTPQNSAEPPGSLADQLRSFSEENAVDFAATFEEPDESEDAEYAEWSEKIEQIKQNPIEIVEVDELQSSFYIEMIEASKQLLSFIITGNEKEISFDAKEFLWEHDIDSGRLIEVNFNGQSQWHVLVDEKLKLESQREVQFSILGVAKPENTAGFLLLKPAE
ncbi:hypothetical protein [Aliikangiella coralliicola]|uniref:Lipoprotein n=1 Tax=Aliikangiella coralliicola TaxID=2592383 RepID=A0A545UA55_9GAMM|nr:hypothetical protein [Aliikangiella coralliicola]TQV86354.1 hypothetical protein FLL46_15640 [Aliikangiella coralliicola]